MKLRTGFVLITIFAVLLASQSCGGKQPAKDEVAVLETSYGRIVFELLPDVAPKHVENFKTLATEGFYDGTKFHRIAKEKDQPLVIQGGDPNTINGDPATWGQGQRGQKTVPAEFSSLKHVRGVVSAARKTEPNSATSQFFICITAFPSFDGQYSIFGRVIDGMNVVDAIAKAPLVPQTERPIDPVVVNHVYIAKRGELK